MNIENLTAEINETLGTQVLHFSKQITEIDEQLIPVADALSQFLAEGKRFRPLFAAIGLVGAGGKVNSENLKAICALELLQASALIHDDLMDSSDTRRGRPAIHTHFSKIHGETFGAAAAILIGDIALVWSDQAIQESGISKESLATVAPIFAVMRNELLAGQFLDVYEQTQSKFSIERSLKIARYKSGKYSIERPLHFGAALTAKSNLNNLFHAYSEYGLPLGEAFQLRDDLLGVFGDPEITGKPAGDDLKEGKRTALIAYAYDRGDEATKSLLNSKLGKDLSEIEIASLREVIEKSGALIHIEDLIEKLVETALEALDQDVIDLEAKELLQQMALLVSKRTR